MSTYYDAEDQEYYEEEEDEEIFDDEPEDDGSISGEDMTDQERREHEILQIHPFIKNRSVKIKSYDQTRREGWTSGSRSSIVGKTGTVMKVHERVTEAVEVKVDGDTNYWHFKDLELLDPAPLPDPVLFNPLSLVIG